MHIEKLVNMSPGVRSRIRILHYLYRARSLGASRGQKFCYIFTVPPNGPFWWFPLLCGQYLIVHVYFSGNTILKTHGLLQVCLALYLSRSNRGDLIGRPCMEGQCRIFATDIEFLVAKPRKFIDFATVYKSIAISNPAMSSVSGPVKVFFLSWCGPIPYLGQTLRSVGKKVLHLAF